MGRPPPTACGGRSTSRTGAAGGSIRICCDLVPNRILLRREIISRSPQRQRTYLETRNFLNIWANSQKVPGVRFSRAQFSLSDSFFGGLNMMMELPAGQLPTGARGTGERIRDWTL